MAKIVLRDASITVNGVNLSDHCSEVEINSEFDDAETTSFGSTYKQYAQGMGDATISLTFYQDFAAASVDATFWPISQSGAAVPVVVKPTSGAVSATNPSYTMQGILFNYSPLAGEVGEPSSTETEFKNGSAAGLVRATA